MTSMKHSVLSTGARVLALATLAAAAGGCATGTIEEGVPTAAEVSAAKPASGMAANIETEEPSEPTGTGDFPNLNIRQVPATKQFTPGDQKAKETQLLQARKQAQSTPPANEAALASDAAQLRKLGKTHADDALKEIEAQ